MGESKNRKGLGFRDLENVNVTLLAKQRWRLMMNPNLMVATIIKEKYFKQKNLLEAKLGSRPSFIWRSLFSSLELVQVGLMSRVGNGKTIKI